jgi:hypothetical protein
MFQQGFENDSSMAADRHLFHRSKALTPTPAPWSSPTPVLWAEEEQADEDKKTTQEIEEEKRKNKKRDQQDDKRQPAKPQNKARVRKTIR